MSLKWFHVVFIAVSTLLALGVGVWGIRTHLARPGGIHLGLGIVSLLIGVALVVYGTRFVQRMGKLR